MALDDLAFFAAPAEIGDRPDATGLDPRQDRCGVARGERDAEAARRFQRGDIGLFIKARDACFADVQDHGIALGEALMETLSAPAFRPYLASDLIGAEVGDSVIVGAAITIV